MPIKLVVWDLDNTLWEGTIFYKEEGVKLKPGTAAALKELTKQGIKNTICSKNYTKDALDFLEKFEIAKYFEKCEIGWGKKSDSIKKLAEIFGAKFDEVYFVDDDAFQRAEVAAMCPGIYATELKDPLDILTQPGILPEQGTDTDKDRVKLLKEQRDREEAEKRHAGDYEKFLVDCNIKMRVRQASAEDWERVVQLLNRTNELNTTGNRYTEESLKEHCAKNNGLIIVAELVDKFGDYGLIAEAVVDREKDAWKINDLTVSCRTMGRGVGQSLLISILQLAKKSGVKKIKSYLRETKENWRMMPLYEKRGFKQVSKEGAVTNYEFNFDEKIADYPLWIRCKLEKILL